VKRVWLLTPMDVPGDTDPARVAEVFNRHLDDDDGLLCQWGEWLPGTARLSEAPWQPGGSGGYAYATGEGSVAIGGAGGSSGGNSGPWPASGGNGSNSVVRHAHGLNESCNAGRVVLGAGGAGRVG
jgi:hypothetical protein